MYLPAVYHFFRTCAISMHLDIGTAVIQPSLWSTFFGVHALRLMESGKASRDDSSGIRGPSASLSDTVDNEKGSDELED